MTKNINSFILPDDVIALMKEKQKQSVKKNKEFGFAMCARKTDNVIEAKNITERFPEEVFVETRCPGGYNNIGGFHTHPETERSSGTDLLISCNNIADCVGVSDKIKCYIRKRDIDPINCTKEFSELASLHETPLRKIDNEIKRNTPEMLKLNERLGLLIKEKKRTRQLDLEERDIRKKIRYHNESVRSYNKELDEYTGILKRLQDKFFDEIEF